MLTFILSSLAIVLITSFLSFGIPSSFQEKNTMLHFSPLEFLQVFERKNTTTKYMINSCYLLCTYHVVSKKRARCFLYIIFNTH